MDLALEVVFALIVLVSFGAERLAELFGNALFASLRQYGINIASKDVRTVVMVALVALLNAAVIYGLDLDIVAKLLEENSTIVSIGLAAFAATGLSGWSHSIMKYFSGTNTSLIELLEKALAMAKEVNRGEPTE